MSSKIAADRRTFAAMAALAAACALSVATPARAQPSDTDVRVAQSLFDEARTLMKAGAYPRACPKLAESQRLDPALGTLLNLALCHRLEGRMATAWTEFHDAIAVARQQDRADRVEYANAQIREIEPHLSRVTITLGQGTSTPGLVIALDGSPVGDAALGSPLNVDPGAHKIEARAPGKQPWSLDVTIGSDADQKNVVVPALIAIAAATTPSPDTTRRTAGWIVGGGGIAALGVGLLSGLQASSRWSQRNNACVADACTPAGLDADKSARHWATVADVALALGVVGVGVGTYLVLTSGARVEVRTEVGANRGGVVLGGAW